MTRKDFIAQFCIQNYGKVVCEHRYTRDALIESAIRVADTLEEKADGMFFDSIGSDNARLCDQLDLINQKGINVNINEPCEK